MEIRPYVVEQHFGSELVDIEVELGFMETRLKTKNEREPQPNRTPPFILHLIFYIISYIFCQTGFEANYRKNDSRCN